MNPKVRVVFSVNDTWSVSQVRFMAGLGEDTCLSFRSHLLHKSSPGC